jgi:hypothetical protein
LNNIDGSAQYIWPTDGLIGNHVCGDSFSQQPPCSVEFMTALTSVAVPGFGAGLPGLLAGIGAMTAWYRRRRAATI